jgi:branched-chain amino acid transport system substrate-binding protein
VLNDQSGPYRDDGGPTGVVCARQALVDFGVSGLGFNVEVIAADHQNKPDIGASIARQWFDRDGVDAIVDVPTSSVGLAVNTVCREKTKVYLNSGTGTSDLTGPQCSPNTVHWTYDTYMLGKSTGGATVASGGDTWFFITADYVFGQTLQRDTAGIVTKAGGKVLSSIAYPFPETTDFSSMLVRAQASGAKVLGLAMAGADMENCIKQAHEFGISKTMTIAALLIQVRGVRALGLDTAAGMRWSESYYWDLNDRTRAWNERVRTKTPNGVWPNMTQAGDYAATLHYLKAVKDMGIAAAKADGRAVVDRMKAMPTDDDCFGPGLIRADGRALHPVYLLEAKKPSESKQSWDIAKVVSTTPKEDAFRPLSEGGCPFIKA